MKNYKKTPIIYAPSAEDKIKIYDLIHSLGWTFVGYYNQQETRNWILSINPPDFDCIFIDKSSLRFYPSRSTAMLMDEKSFIIANSPNHFINLCKQYFINHLNKSIF